MSPYLEQQQQLLKLQTQMYKFFLILISFSAYTHAWWDTGHALVCDEAYKRLSPEIQKKVDELIDGRFDNYGAACIWPDEVKAIERPETRPWHYVNLPRGKVKVIPQPSVDRCF